MSLSLKRTLSVGSAAVLAVALAACGGSNSSSTASDTGGTATLGQLRRLQDHQQAQQISITPVHAGTLTVETTLPAQGWWNGTTPESIKSGYEYCMAAELANMAGLPSVTVKNVSFAQLVAGQHQRLRHRPRGDLDHPGAREGRRLLDAVLRLQRRRPDRSPTPTSPRQHQVEEAARRTPARRRSTSSRTTLGVNPTIFPELPDALPGRDLRAGRRGLPRHRDRAGRGEGIQRQPEVVGQYATGEKYGAIYPKGSANEDASQHRASSRCSRTARWRACRRPTSAPPSVATRTPCPSGLCK